LCCTSLAQQKPLKVFLLIGQSNMQGHAHVRTLDHLALNDDTKPVLAEIVDDQGKPRKIDDVWISYLSAGGVKSGPLTTGFGASEDKIGPELTFGINMQKRLGEPILIIKSAWGGKSLNTDFRPPSAGPYVFNQAALERFENQNKNVEIIKAEKVKATGVFYAKTINHIKETLANIDKIVPDYREDQGFELAGVVWFQGWNDMVDSGTYPRRNEEGGYRRYSENLVHFIRDIRKDLESPELPFVIGVMGVGGPTEKYSKQQQRYKTVHQGFRNAMAAPAKTEEFRGNVVNVLTEQCWDLELDSAVRKHDQLRALVKRLVKKEDIDSLASQLASEGASEEDLKQELSQLKDRRDFERTVTTRLLQAKLSKRENEILNKGKSNAAFHYLGSAKIMTCIGKKFAESMPLEPQD
jgi:alpha-galactosidase